jgi:hypothetical protein
VKGITVLSSETDELADEGDADAEGEVVMVRAVSGNVKAHVSNSHRRVSE